MQNLYTSKQIKKIDELANAKHHINPLILMENAATNVTSKIRNYIENKKLNVKKIAIFCGSGNNGGDGFVIAKQLSSDFEVSVFFVGTAKKFSQETTTNFNIINSINEIQILQIENEKMLNDLELNFDCIIDAIIGVGFSGILNPFVTKIIEKINSATALKIAVDIPTGLNSDAISLNNNANQTIPNNIFNADLTISILGAKIGMIFGTSKNFCGEIQVAELAVGGNLANENCTNFLLVKEDIHYIFPKREENSNKYDYGKVVVIAGSKNMAGAAALAANSAIKSGAGLVYLFSTNIHQAVLPEIITEKIAETNDGSISNANFRLLNNHIEKANSVIIGPGIGQNIETLEMVKKLVYPNLEKRIIIDADALRAFDENVVLSKTIVLTPHFGEFTRLLNPSRNLTKNEIEENKVEILQEIASKMNCTILLKGQPTIISDGEKTYWNTFGNAGMATAGSGDVLSGIIGSLLARQAHSNVAVHNISEIVAFAALFHSLSGDIYAEKYGMESLTASELIKSFKYIV